MCAVLGKLANIPDYNMMVTQVTNDKIDQILAGEYKLDKLGYSPQIHVYEIAKSDPTNVIVQVYSREQVCFIRQALHVQCPQGVYSKPAVWEPSPADV